MHVYPSDFSVRMADHPGNLSMYLCIFEYYVDVLVHRWKNKSKGESSD